MADIWTSYTELGELCACSADEAHALIVARGWPRRRCSDGAVRVKLPADLAHQFMRQSVFDARPSMPADVNGASLRGLLGRVTPGSEARLA